MAKDNFDRTGSVTNNFLKILCYSSVNDIILLRYENLIENAFSSHQDLSKDTLYMKKLRRNARMLCIQHLYAYLQQKDETLDNVIKRSLLLNEDPEFDEEFFRTLIHKTVREIDGLDERIKKRSKNWDFSRITLMDKIILRQSIAEMMYIADVPPRVTISEAIELAKEFSTEESHVFVNGMLDRIYKDLVEEGILLPDITPVKEG